MTPRPFYQRHTFWTFWRFSACIWAKLAPIYSKRHWQRDILLFPLVSQFMTFLLRHAQKSKFRDFWTRKWPTALGFSFCYFFLLPFVFFSFPYLFAVVIDLLLCLLPVKKVPRKHYWEGQLLPWSSHYMWQEILLWLFYSNFWEILLWVFHSNFWAFSCIFQAPLNQSLWSGCHWKNLFLLQKLSIDEANFEQRWLRQMWTKANARRIWLWVAWESMG